jgi:hypothetical protein
MAFIYAIHDSYYPGCSDGDVDDRAAIQYYDKYLCEHHDVGYIVVYLVGEGRFENAIPYMDLQTNQGKRIVFENAFNVYEAIAAQKILICAPVPDENVRTELAKIIRTNQNGYCQGDKIGVTNFPKPEYEELLESIPVHNRFSTQSTAIQFPTNLLDILDPQNKGEYMSYGLLKLIAIGGIIHIPSLIYRLYCPEIGGGPGTNMLKIQELIQKHLVPMMRNGDYDQTKVQQLNELIVYKGNFEEFNALLIDIVSHKEIYISSNMNLVHNFMTIFQEKMPDANHTAMENALKVMIYFARMIYVTTDAGLLFDESTTKFYSLSEMPQGNLMIELDDTPPLYDFVVAYLVMNGYDNQERFLTDPHLTQKMMMEHMDN